MQQRNHTLDTIRGISVAMMFVFHLIFDLNYFKFTEIPLFSNIFYILWRYLIVSLFLIAVGVSLVYAYRNNFILIKFFRRLLILSLACIFVSLGSYVVFPDSWIYFGILHMILVGSIVAIFFIRLPNLSAFIALLIFALQYIEQPEISFIFATISTYLPKSTVDFYPLFPWLAMILIGISLGHSKSFNRINIRIKIFSFLGRNALILYLTHQIILFNTVWLVYYIVTTS